MDTFYIDPIQIAKQNGIDVKPIKGVKRNLKWFDSYEYIPEDLCGYIEKQDNGKVVIYYNPNHHENRQRFTIAHELGHYFLNHLDNNHKKYRDLRENFNINNFDYKEVEANKYAAELLMPKDKIDFLIYTKGITNIEELAQILKVSTMALTYRLKNLGYIQ